jgi:hypothetical protein
MKIASKTATKLICAALPLAVTLSPASVPAVTLWSVSRHWNASLGHALTTIVAASAARLPDGLSVGRGEPWGIVAPVGPDLSDEVDKQ